MLRFANMTLLLGYLVPVSVAAEDVRYCHQNGVTYRETRAIVKQPIAEIQYRELSQTVPREQYTTELRDVQRNKYVPVTRYAWEPRWHGQWNILREPQLAYHLVPYTTWELRRQTVRVPMTRRNIVPETRAVRVPQTNLRYADRGQITRVPAGPATMAGEPHGTSGTPTTRSVDGGTTYGGVARLDSDPPRYGIATRVGDD